MSFGRYLRVGKNNPPGGSTRFIAKSTCGRIQGRGLDQDPTSCITSSHLIPLDIEVCKCL